MKKILLTTAGIMALGTTLTATAASGIYFAGEAGYAQRSGMPDKSTSTVFGSTITSKKEDDQNLAGRIAIGYNYDISSTFGLGAEVGYGYYGETRYAKEAFLNGNYKATAWDLLAVGTWHITNKWDLIGKGGLAYETLRDDDDQLLDFGDHADKVVPMIALGTAYNITPNFAATLTYYHLFGDKVTLDNNWGNNYTVNNKSYGGKEQVPSINALFLGLKYTF